MPSDRVPDEPGFRQRLTTARLDLEPLAPHHADEMLAPLQDQGLHVFIPQEPPVSLEALRDRYQRLAIGHSPDGDELWLNWVARRRDTGDLIGIFQATIRGDRTADIAYIIFVHEQRRGFAREGCDEMIRHLAADLRVEIAGADIDTRNIASISLIERLGFTRVRTTHDADYFKGGTSHEYRYERVLSRPG